MGKLTGKVAIVTGASRGIGQQIAELFASEGAKVVCAARTMNEGEHRMLEGSLTRTVDLIRGNGGEATAVTADVSSEAECIALVEAARQAYGPIDILVNNAALNYYLPTDTYPTNRWMRCFAINVHAPFILSKAVLTDMVPRRSGAIVNISSGAAIGPGRGPYDDKTVRGGVMYGTTKAALERFTQGLAQEVAQYDGITVAAVSPSLVVPDPGHNPPQVGRRPRRPQRRAPNPDGSGCPAACQRTAGKGERASDLQPADPEGVWLDRGSEGKRRKHPGLRLLPGVGRTSAHDHRLFPDSQGRHHRHAVQDLIQRGRERPSSGNTLGERLSSISMSGQRFRSPRAFRAICPPPLADGGTDRAVAQYRIQRVPPTTIPLPHRTRLPSSERRVFAVVKRIASLPCTLATRLRPQPHPSRRWPPVSSVVLSDLVQQRREKGPHRPSARLRQPLAGLGLEVSGNLEQFGSEVV